MKWITQPYVHVLAVPMFSPHPEYLLPPGGTNCENLIAHAGKGCYDSYGPEGRSVGEHIRSLRNTRHGSVFEHACISLFIDGISRGCSHEIVRHRAGFSYSQRSTRYTREDGASFVLDPFYSLLQNKHIEALGPVPSDPMEQAKWFEDKYNPGAGLDMDEAAILNQFKSQCDMALESYSQASEWLFEIAPKDLGGVARRKWARGKARQLLPHALETRMTMTGNLRSWRFFLEERSSKFAEPEIRRLAEAIMNKIAGFAPVVFEDMLDNPEVYEGFPVYKPEVPKV